MRTLNTIVTLAASLVLSTANGAGSSTSEPNATVDEALVREFINKNAPGNWVCGTPDGDKFADSAREVKTEQGLSSTQAINGANPNDPVAEAHDPVIIVDFNNDSSTDMSDLIVIMKYWGMCITSPTPCLGDTNHDGVVDKADLINLIMELD